MPPAAAVAVSSALFGLWHHVTAGDWLQVAFTTVLGLVLGFARTRVPGCTTLSTGIAHGAYGALLAVLAHALAT